MHFFCIISGHNCIISLQFPPSCKASGGEGVHTATHQHWTVLDYFFLCFCSSNLVFFIIPYTWEIINNILLLGRGEGYNATCSTSCSSFFGKAGKISQIFVCFSGGKNTSLLFVSLTRLLSRPWFTPTPEQFLFLELNTAGAAYSWLLLIFFFFFHGQWAKTSTGEVTAHEGKIWSVSVYPQLLCNGKCWIHAAVHKLWDLCKSGGPGRAVCSNHFLFVKVTKDISREGWVTSNRETEMPVWAI